MTRKKFSEGTEGGRKSKTNGVGDVFSIQQLSIHPIAGRMPPIDGPHPLYVLAVF